MTHAIHSVLISNRSDLQSAVRRLPDQPAVAVDTESNSMYAYRERVCLVQLSFPGADILIDPMSPAIDASELGPFFPVLLQRRAGFDQAKPGLAGPSQPRAVDCEEEVPGIGIYGHEEPGD